MATIPLSNGSSLTVPDDVSDEDAQRYYDEAEALLKAEADNGSDPVPVEDRPGWDWLRDKAPGVFNFGHEAAAGIAEGVGDLPNLIPNVVNKANQIYHLHADEAGTPPPQPLMDQFMTGPGLTDKPLAELNPQTPGYEGVRDYGRMTGAALPLGPAAAVAIPALSKLGSGIGSVADYFTGDPSVRDMPLQDYMMSDEPPGKWSQTVEFVAPLATGLAVKGGRAVVNSPTAAKVGGAAVKASGPLAAITTLMKTGSLPSAYVAGKAAPATLRGLGKAASYAMPALKPLADLAEGPGIAGLLARAIAPAAVDDERRRQ